MLAGLGAGEQSSIEYWLAICSSEGDLTTYITNDVNTKVEGDDNAIPNTQPYLLEKYLQQTAEWLGFNLTSQTTTGVG